MMVKRSFLRHIYKKRRSWIHKGQSGKLLIVGGNNVYVGAPMFAATAAMRSGCDLVYVAAPQRPADIIARIPDLITYRLKGDNISKMHLKQLLSISKNMDALVIGNGIGTSGDTMSAVNGFLTKCTIPAVIDADAIRAVARKPSLLNGRIVTPHTGEFFVLSGKKLNSNLHQRKIAAKKFAQQYNCIIVLKGHVDIITDGRKIALNKTGNVFMTKGGTGDTLAGICGALVARGIDHFEAACAAAYINGAAGDLAACEKKESLLASDIVENIAKVIV